MKNFVQEAKVVKLTAPSALLSGGVVEVGSLVGIAVADAQAGEQVSVLLEGAVSLTRNPADAFSEGDVVYWDSGAGHVTTSSGAGANTRLGASLETLAAGAGSIVVRLDGVSV